MNTVAVVIPNPAALPVVTVNWDSGATTVITPTATVSIPIGVGVPGRDGNAVTVPPVTQTITAQASADVAHSFAYIPRVTIVDQTGAEADTDVTHTAGHVYLTFAQPFTGTVIVS